jgi:hypothetical protein
VQRAWFAIEKIAGQNSGDSGLRNRINPVLLQVVAVQQNRLLLELGKPSDLQAEHLGAK